MKKISVENETGFTRREFVEMGMWGTLMLYAGAAGLSSLVETPALAQHMAAPKELALNPYWWNRVFAYVMAMCEIPYLEFELEPGKNDEEFFGKVNLLMEKINWGTRVVPIGKAIHPKTEILPYQEFEEVLMRSEVQGIGECWCRTTFKNCDRPTNTCILLGFPGNRLDLENKGHVAKVSRDEIRAVIKRAEEAGLVHELIRAGDDDTYYVICNCCPCCCAGLRGLVEFGNKGVIHSEFIPQTNDNCEGCGTCLGRCYFNARTLADGKIVVDPEKCLGCGLCCTGCPNEANFLVKRQEEVERKA